MYPRGLSIRQVLRGVRTIEVGGDLCTLASRL